MSINVNNAYEITENLSFPRLIGTEGGIKARKLVAREFERIGYTPIREKFLTSYMDWIIARYIFLLIGSLLIFLALSVYINVFLAIGALVILIFIGINMNKLISSSKIRLTKNNNFETENIYGKLKSKNSKRTIIFMAHWDSKSQSFNSFIRIIIFMVVIFNALIIIIVFLITIILRFLGWDNPVFNLIMLIYTSIIAIIGFLIFFNKTANESPGATDNAASVGVMLELARYFKDNPPKDVDIIFLSTGSEELNLGGAKTFINNHENELDRSSTYFINLDGIGTAGTIQLITSYGIPKKNSSNLLNNLFKEIANNMNIFVKPHYLATGVWSDYMPIVQKGFEACWLTTSGSIKYVHTKNDTMRKVSKEGLKKIIQLCVKVVKKLEKE